MNKQNLFSGSRFTSGLARLVLVAGLVAAGATLLLGLALVLDGALSAQAADDPGPPLAGHDQIQLSVSVAVPRREPPGQGDVEADGSRSTEGAARQALFNLPLRFIANAGQTDPAVRFTVKGAGHTLFFTEEEVVFAASSRELTAEEAENAEKSHHNSADSAISAVKSVVRLRFEGAQAQPAIEGLGRLPGVANFFIGDDPAQWQVNVPTYEALVYRDLYPGIDLVYRGTAGRLKSEFHLAAGADPAAIVMVYSGLQGARLRADGALVLQTPLGELVEEPPLIYQEVDGAWQIIPGRYALLPGGGRDDPAGRLYRVRFRVGAHDRARPLVIDPALDFSTYLGGGDSDHGLGIAADGAGNAYVTGGTWSSDFPTANAIDTSLGGLVDAFVTQIISASGVYTYGYSTYLGGGSDDLGYGIAVDGAGAVYVAGYTWSSDFPTANAIDTSLGGSADAFVTKIISAGGVYTLAYSTYLGGSGWDNGSRIAVDGAGNAYVTGWAASGDFPTANAIQQTNRGGEDAFVTQIISASGVYTYGYSTYLGGGSGDYCWGIAVDGAGNAYVTGYTDSSDFPTAKAIDTSLGGSRDAFVTQIIRTGGVYTLAYSTYLGGSGWDHSYGIAVDGAGNAYMTGYTDSGDFPTASAIQQTNRGGYDAFVTQVISAGGIYTYGYSTYLGGGDEDNGYGIAVDGAGNAYVTGDTYSSDFPTANAIDTSLGGLVDAFVTHIISAGGVYAYGYSTYLGGGGSDIGMSIAVDGARAAYVAGTTASNDFPTANAIDTSLGGNVDAFVARIALTADLSIAKSGWWDGKAGSPITYTITVRNAGPDDANDATVSDPVPPGIGGFSGSCATGGGATCGWGGSGDISDTVDLPVGGVVTYTVLGTVTISGTVVNTATVAVPAGITDPMPGNNQAVHVAQGPHYFPIIFKNYRP
jgi:uncharacterized repeat protein (TIGR01451 family)